MKNETLFLEKQRFTQWWLWLIMILVVASAFYYEESTLEKIVVLVILIPFFLFVLNLETEISSEGISVRFFPFHLKKKFFAWDEIVKAEVREYSPLLEYGGWGIRRGKSGVAYNVKGNMGLQLVLKSGKKILIGTQKTEELKQILVERENKK
ncbi:MAG: hypothetical protein IKU78_06160 [Paludibacteraceae bacterium]|nr:hypothetical protein [Paludibacteraceae bacterium]